MRIVFTPLLQGKPFNGNTIYKEGLGGSESAVVFLARSLAKRGHDVTVYASGQEGVVDDVEYCAGDRIGEVQNEPIDAYISSRWVDALALPQQAKVKALWLHDNLYQGWNCPHAVNFVVTLSRFHQMQFAYDGTPASLPQGVIAIGNGIDTRLFIGHEQRDRNRLIWTSNPDRGLYIAGRIFQRLRKRYPELELHVYGRAAVYGWGPEAEVPYMPDDLTNIFLHDPLPKKELARELMKSWIWFYPHHWAESFCIAALEAQAAGCVPLATPLAALNEVVQHGVTGVLTNDFEAEFARLRETEGLWQALSEQGKAWAMQQDWDVRAEQWEQQILRCMPQEAPAPEADSAVALIGV